MEELLNINNLVLFVVIILPGFISQKIWNIISPSAKHKVSEIIYELVLYSFMNYAIFFWLIRIAIDIQNNNKILSYILLILVAVGPPIFWPIIIKKIFNSKLLKGKIVHPTPKAWDYFFSKGLPCFMLIHLNDGKLIGGLYFGDSFASSNPEKEDIYLQEVWKIDKEGRFISKIKRTMGLLINCDTIKYIELFTTK